jgi:signal transduction histidine kinase
MASIVAVSMIRALRIFDLESRRRLEAAKEAERRSREKTEQLYRELQYAARDLSVLFETSRIMVSTLDLRTLLDEAIGRIVSVLEPIQAGIILLYDQSGQLSVFTSYGYGEPTDEARLSHCRQAGTQAVETHKVVLSIESGQIREVTLADALAPPPDRLSDGLGLEREEMADVIAVPLLAKSGVMGSLVLEQHQAAARFTRSDIPFIEALARQLGVAIENVRLYEELQRRDALRGQLLRRAISAQEEERQRIARELHDETGQALTALAVGLGGVEGTLDTDPDLARQQLGQLKELSMRALEELRQLVADLRPSLLDDLGLVPALRWYAKHYQETLPTQVSIEVSGDRRRLPQEIETVLFRIAQEALSNIARHAAAGHAVIRLEYGPSQVTLITQDDGKGFEPEQVLGPQATRGGWGLVGIQERVTLAGGHFEVQSQPGAGTTLTVQIPITGEEVRDVEDQSSARR